MVSGSFVHCPYCPCMFVSQSDLDLHLKRFGDYDHYDLWHCVQIVLEADGHDAGVDDHGRDWGSKRKRVSRSTIRKCRAILEEHGFIL